jgi:hypothetical protein
VETQPEPNQGADESGDPIVAVLTIGMVLLLTALEIGLLLPEVLRYAHGLMDAIYLSISFLTLNVLWLACLYVERRNQYDSKEAKWHRRRGYLVQAIIFASYTVSQIQDKHPFAPLALALLILLTVRMWHLWLKVRALTPERQAEIDELIAEAERRLAERIVAEQARASEARFQVVRAKFALHEAPAVETAVAQEPRIDWRIPKGRHTPVVYFLRNGDRIKIGTTTDLRARVRRLSLRMDDLALVIPGDRAVERKMHQTFRGLRVGNTEWFRSAEPLTAFIAEHAAAATKEA